MTETPRSPAPAPRSLYALALLMLPLMIGARDCERVVVGAECDGGPCASEDGGGNTQNGCLYAGEHYAVGEGFSSEDGCNTCSCTAGGQVACTLRACASEICGGLQGAQCSGDRYCKFAPDAACGAADQTGICSVKPQACGEIYAPVCGCDGKTYGNECEAAGAGTSVATRGECGGGSEPGGSCGGLIGQPCATGQFCDYPLDALCGAADATGVCRDIPQACTLEYSPVCGCDDKTYGNACDAASHGTSVAKRGECGVTIPPTGASCGSRGQAPCADGQYCNFPAGADCGRADAPGSCTDIPQACTREFNPVCGCDGQTYNNPCEAAVAGVSVESSGACGGTGSGDTCGGIAGLQCAAGEYCNFPIAAMCGAGDQTGTCTATPSACDAIYQPVCGCDDKTYGNDCEAALAGQSVAAEGECGGTGGTFCGGFIGAQCAADEYCSYPKSANCGRADASGECAPRPEACTQQFDPVCGCDGETYSNACMAANKGVSVEFDQACN